MKNIFDRARLFFCKDKEFRSALYQIMGFCPHNIDLYRTAFAHKSHEYRSKKTGNKPLNNERLEFLGDAVLETVVSHIVYRQYPNKREGFLTNTRSKIVSRESLGKLAKELGIDRLIQSQTHGRTHNSYLEGNSFEALMGAIYLDRGFRYAFQFIEKRIIGAVLDLDTVANKEVNFKSKLLEWKQKNRIHLDFVDSSGNNSNSTSPSFHTTVVIEGIPAGEGKGFSKKESHQAAAKDALTQMRRDADFLDAMFRAKEKRTAMGAEEFFALPHISEIDEEIAKERSAAKSERNNNRAERKNERKNEKNARDDKRNERKSEKEERKEEQKEERRNERREERQNAKNNREERNNNAQPAQKNREEQSVQQPQSVENENRKPAKAQKTSTPREPRPIKGEVAVEKNAAIAEPEKTEEAFVEVPTQPVAQALKADNVEVEPAAAFGVAVATPNAEVVSKEDEPTLIPIEFIDLTPEPAETHDVAELDPREEPTVAELDSQEKQTVAQPSLEDLQEEIDNWVEAAEHACEFVPTEKTTSQEVADVAQENAVISPTEVVETVEADAAISKEQDAESVNEAVVSEPISDGNAVEETATPVAEATTPELETTSAETAEVVVDDSEEVASSVEVVVDAEENAPRVRSEQEKKRARRQNKRQNAANFANTTLPPAEQSHRAQKAARKQEEQAEKRKEENRKRQVKKMQQELAESFKLDVDIDDFVVVETTKSEISPAETPELPNTNGEEMRDEKRKNNRSRSGKRPNNRRRGGNRSNTAQGEGKRNDAAATAN
ncbi:MAG: ribonuclease III [Alloprevotella sp.]|nr:MAG: ribonuclease III [Alloprevotella sp.]